MLSARGHVASFALVVYLVACITGEVHGEHPAQTGATQSNVALHSAYSVSYYDTHVCSK